MLSIAVIALMLSGATVPSMAFKNYSLGMSIDEATALPLGTDRFGAKTFECSNRNTNIHLQPDKDHKAAGVVKCHPMQWIGSSQVYAGFPLSEEINAYADFFFVDNKLFKIDIYTTSSSYSPVYRSLQIKFGRPQSTVDDEMQVRSGAKFPRTSTLWKRGTQFVKLTNPAKALDRMNVLYLDSSLDAEVERRIPREPIM